MSQMLIRDNCIPSERKLEGAAGCGFWWSQSSRSIGASSVVMGRTCADDRGGDGFDGVNSASATRSSVRSRSTASTPRATPQMAWMLQPVKRLLVRVGLRGRGSIQPSYLLMC